MRLRLILSFALIVVVSIGSVVLIAWRGTTSEVRSFMYGGGMAGLRTVVDALESYYQENGSWEGAEELLQTGHGRMMRGMGAGMMDQRLRLADAQGNLIVDTGSQLPASQLSKSELGNAIPLQVNLRTAGYLLAEGGMGFGPGDERFLMARLSRAAVSAGLIAAAAALLLALLLAYGLLRPVRELTLAAKMLAKGDLSQRVAVHGDDELAALGRTFNHMANSLQNAEESRRALTADIAHELRNPLAVQRANLEAMQDGVFPLTADHLNPILEQNLLLTRLVEDLRTLALAESGQLKLERTAVDFPALVQRVAERFEPQANARQVKIKIDQERMQQEPDVIFLDPMRFEQILGNLLSNALRFTPEGGWIRIDLEAAQDELRLTVWDNGPGIPPEALTQIFERFFRADRARSRTTGGSGLGLAIARRLAQAHGGSLGAANHPQGGAIFTLALPLPASDE